MSPPSTPSDSSVLALHDFTYGREVHGVDYPHDHDHDLSQPPTPAANHDPSSPFPRRSRARAYSLSSIDHGRPSSSSRSRDRENDLDEEYALGYGGRKPGADEGHMDAFTISEITVMTGSSLMVLGLIVVAATLTLGKIKL